MDRPNGYNVLIIYGRFGFTPINKKMWNVIGFDDDIIKEMEYSEMYQSLHRGRPILHPAMPIISMTDKDLFPNLDAISISVIELFKHHYDIDIKMPYKQIAKQMEITSPNKISQFKKFIQFIREYIYGIEYIDDDDDDLENLD